MINRFLGKDNEPNLISALKRQTLINGNIEILDKIKSNIVLKSYKKDDIVFAQGDSSNEIYFILTGSVSVSINGRVVAIRNESTHFGEMSAINPAALRSATIKCLTDIVIGVLSEIDFRAICDEYPAILRSIAEELSNRLNQRNRLVRPVNPIPILFIASSSESLFVAQQFKNQLEDVHLKVNLWSDLGVFNLSRFPIQDLEDQVKASDFSLIVFGADDKILSRWRLFNGTRDNVLLELGLFVGALTHERAFIALPKNKKIKIPTDIIGINTLRFDPRKDLINEIKTNSIEIKTLIKKMGCI